MLKYLIGFLWGIAFTAVAVTAAEKAQEKDFVEISQPIVVPPSDCFCPICVDPDSQYQ